MITGTGEAHTSGGGMLASRHPFRRPDHGGQHPSARRISFALIPKPGRAEFMFSLLFGSAQLCLDSKTGESRVTLQPTLQRHLLCLDSKTGESRVPVAMH